MTWTTITSYVDVETGEALTLRQIEKGHYVKLKCDTKHKLTSKDYGTKYNIWRCERNRQTKLEI